MHQWLLERRPPCRRLYSTKAGISISWGGTTAGAQDLWWSSQLLFPSGGTHCCWPHLPCHLSVPMLPNAQSNLGRTCGYYMVVGPLLASRRRRHVQWGTCKCGVGKEGMRGALVVGRWGSLGTVQPSPPKTWKWPCLQPWDLETKIRYNNYLIERLVSLKRHGVGTK